MYLTNLLMLLLAYTIVIEITLNCNLYIDSLINFLSCVNVSSSRHHCCEPRATFNLILIKVITFLPPQGSRFGWFAPLFVCMFDNISSEMYFGSIDVFLTF